MSLHESPDLKVSTHPVNTTYLANEAYVLHLASLPSFYAASASSPSNAIHVYDRPSLRHVQSLSGHTNGITSLKTASRVGGIDREVLVSSGRDGLVNVWDERANTFSIKMSSAGRPRALLSCAVSGDGLTVAAGTDLQSDEAFVLYWDPRNPAAPLRKHGSTHSDDITALHFMENSSMLLSASTDGLVSVSDSQEDDEDEAVVHVGNWGCSVSQAGWTGAADGPQIWAASDMETFSTWSGELDLAQSLDIREPKITNETRPWVTDYLINCDSKVPGTSNLGVFVGSNEGDIALITNPSLGDAASPWTLNRLWTRAHAGVVRSLLWDEQHNILLTGGEDAKINVWVSAPLEDTPVEEDEDSMEVDDEPKRKRSHKEKHESGSKKARRS